MALSSTVVGMRHVSEPKAVKERRGCRLTAGADLRRPGACCTEAERRSSQRP